VTLVELLVAMSIVTILLVVAGFEYRGWQGKYRVEGQVTEFHSDIMNARTRAMHRNRVHFVRLESPTAYTIYEDDSNGINKVPDGDGTLQPGTGVTADTLILSRTVEYPISWNNAAIGAAISVPFNSRGLATTSGEISVYVDNDADGKKDFDPDSDCIEIEESRINMGHLNDKGTTSRADDECDSK
jgi:type II secretory pathway pseudopilin PulG